MIGAGAYPAAAAAAATEAVHGSAQACACHPDAASRAHSMQYSHVREQDAFELEDGFVVHHNGSCVLRMLLPVDLVVWVLPLLLL